MTDSATCDRCGADLLAADVRYVAEMKVWAAYDVIEIGSRRKLEERNLHNEYIETLMDAAKQTRQEAEDSVYWLRRFDLCADCRKELQADPLGRNGQEAGEPDEPESGDGES